jgi:menaquinone-dependent protoporphyrinogen oxidase
MPTRVLITYATRTGSTGEVAQAIGEVLRDRGFAVDVSLVTRGLPVEDYQAVVLGSAVRMGCWLPEAIEFVTAHAYALQRVPVATFTVHLNNTGDDAQSVANRRAYLDLVRPVLQPVAEIYLSGAVDPTQLSVLERVMLRAVQAPPGDYRDWDKIRAWAESILNQPTGAH